MAPTSLFTINLADINYISEQFYNFGIATDEVGTIITFPRLIIAEVNYHNRIYIIEIIILMNNCINRNNVIKLKDVLLSTGSIRD